VDIGYEAASIEAVLQESGVSRGSLYHHFKGKDVLFEEVRYGERPEVKQSLSTVVDATVGDLLRRVVHDRALVSDVKTAGDVERIREEMERAEARKLQTPELKMGIGSGLAAQASPFVVAPSPALSRLTPWPSLAHSRAGS
jgi:AcrR family transcriptional regulator